MLARMQWQFVGVPKHCCRAPCEISKQFICEKVSYVKPNDNLNQNAAAPPAVYQNHSFMNREVTLK